MNAPELRASDADRDRAIAALREHTVAGRLTLEEFGERVDRAVAARTVAELNEVARDLPAVPESTRPARRPKRLFGAVLGGSQQTGRWLLPRRAFGFVLFGDLDVDLRRAELTPPLASITVVVILGNVDVYVPEGVEVDLGGFAVGGHRREWGPESDHPSLPLLRVTVLSLLGTADVWKVPASWAGRTFREVIRGLRKGELPPAG